MRSFLEVRKILIVLDRLMLIIRIVVVKFSLIDFNLNFISKDKFHSNVQTERKF